MSIEIKERQYDFGPQRASWQFVIQSSALLDGAKVKLAHHQNRLAYWETELATASQALKESMEVRSVAVTGGMNYTAVFDQEKQSRVSLATSKRDGHRGSVERFTAWVNLLGSKQVPQFLPCTVDDAEYFGLGDNSPSATEPGARS